MSEPRKLEVGAYAVPSWEYGNNPMLIAANWYGKFEAHDDYKRLRLESHQLTPCDPPADSPLGRAEARVAELEMKCLELRRVLQEHGIQWPEGFAAPKERSEDA